MRLDHMQQRELQRITNIIEPYRSLRLDYTKIKNRNESKNKWCYLKFLLNARYILF